MELFVLEPTYYGLCRDVALLMRERMEGGGEREREGGGEFLFVI